MSLLPRIEGGCCKVLHKHGAERVRQGLSGVDATYGADPTTVLQINHFSDYKAEGERFELSDDVTAVNGFRDRPVQPLRHPSER
jgi:hypothetical protein